MGRYNEPLFRGLDEKGKEEFRRLLAHSALIRRLREILTEEISVLENTSKTDYEKAAWAFYQADKNGELRALKKILNLLDQREQDV